MEAPKIPSFFKPKKPDRFEFKPRYYSERKEKMKERYERIQREIDNDNSSTPDFKSNLRDNWESSRLKKTSKVNPRIFIYLIILLGIVYFMLK